MNFANPCLILSMMVAVACHHTQKKTIVLKVPANYKPIYPGAGPLILGYDRFLAALDSADLHSSRIAYQEFQDRFEDQLPRTCDTAFLLFWNFQTAIQRDSAMDRIGYAALDTLWTAEHEGKPLPDSLQKTLSDLHEDGFSLGMEEGNAYLRSSWALAAPHFLKSVSEPTKELLIQNTKEEEEGFQDDAALVITPVQLARRTIWWERYIDRYPHYAFVEAARTNYNSLLNILVEGMDNTPIVRNDSVITDYYRSAYTFIRDSFPNSRTNATIAPYWQAWRSLDTATIQEIKDSVHRLD